MPEDLTPNNLNEMLVRQHIERSLEEFYKANADMYSPDAQALYKIGKNAAEAGSKLANIFFEDGYYECDIIDNQNNIQHLRIEDGPGAAGFFGNFKITEQSKRAE